MVDVEQCIEEFLNTDEVYVYEKNSVGVYKKQITHNQNNMIVLTFNNGDGVAIIDNEQFSKLPKAKQNKFLKLCK